MPEFPDCFRPSAIAEWICRDWAIYESTDCKPFGFCTEGHKCLTHGQLPSKTEAGKGEVQAILKEEE